MKITPVPVDLDYTSSELVRSPGIHMSDIYNDLYKKLDPELEGWDAKSLNIAGALGFSWESVLEKHLRDRVLNLRPEEFRTKEGVAFSPDMLIFNGHLRLGEIKLKWFSSRDVPREPGMNAFPPRFDKILTQMKSYAYNLETPDGRLYVFFVNGNYRPPKPEVLAWDITFTARELKENWDMMMNHARHRRML